MWREGKYGCWILLLFCRSVMSDSLPTPWTSAYQVSLSFTISQSLLKLMSTESVMLSNHLILCCPHLLLPSIFPSIRVSFFPNELALWIRWPKYWSFIFSISPSNEYSRLTSFRIDWFDILVVQGCWIARGKVYGIYGGLVLNIHSSFLLWTFPICRS